VRVLGVAIDAPMDMRPQTDLDIAVKVDGARLARRPMSPSPRSTSAS
jgi:hypothetical protein